MCSTPYMLAVGGYTWEKLAVSLCVPQLLHMQKVVESVCLKHCERRDDSVQNISASQ